MGVGEIAGDARSDEGVVLWGRRQTKRPVDQEPCCGPVPLQTDTAGWDIVRIEGCWRGNSRSAVSESCDHGITLAIAVQSSSGARHRRTRDTNRPNTDFGARNDDAFNRIEYVRSTARGRRSARKDPLQLWARQIYLLSEHCPKKERIL